MKDTLRSRFEYIEKSRNDNKKLALERMVDIFPEAVDSFHHDIVDSIIMTILTDGDLKLRDYIRLKLKEEKDDYVINIFQEWIEILNKKQL